MLKTSFWSLNIGLAPMALLTLLPLLPLGTMQPLAAIEHGYWHARLAEFVQQPIAELRVWLRAPGDTIFSIGAVTFAWFVLRLCGWARSANRRFRRPRHPQVTDEGSIA